MPQSTAIFWPMIAHIILVFAIYRLLLVRRVKAVKAGNAKVEQFRENRNEPAESLIVRNNLENQFELPTYFHTVCLVLFVTGNATIYPVLLAWAYVISRYMHAYIHLGTNRIRHRMSSFVAGFLIQGLMWLWLAIQLITG